MKDIFRSQLKSFLNRGHIPTLEELNESIVSQKDFADEEEYLNYENKINLWYSETVECFFLKPYLQLKGVNEIIFHGNSKIECLFKNRSQFEKQIISNEDLIIAMETIALLQRQSWNLANPVASFSCRLFQHNLRITLVHSQTTPYQLSKMFIRVPCEVTLELESFTGNTAIINYLKNSIEAQQNILIAGPTASGKTTLLKLMANFINPSEHVIILEDTHELTLSHLNATFLTTEGQHFTLDDCVTWSLRLSPKRLMLGEIRSREVSPFLQAANNGHRGLMATLHANSAKEVPDRLALLMSLHLPSPPSWEVLMKMIVQGIDLIVYVKDKQIAEIIRPIGSDGKNFFHQSVIGNDADDTLQLFNQGEDFRGLGNSS